MTDQTKGALCTGRIRNKGNRFSEFIGGVSRNAGNSAESVTNRFDTYVIARKAGGGTAPEPDRMHAFHLSWNLTNSLTEKINATQGTTSLISRIKFYDCHHLRIT